MIRRFDNWWAAPLATAAWMGIAAAWWLMLLAACTPAEIAQVNAAFTDSQIACLAVFNSSSVIPPGTEVATVAADAETFCNLAKTVETDIEAIEAAYMASAPAPAGAVYRAARRK